MFFQIITFTEYRYMYTKVPYLTLTVDMNISNV